MADLVGVVAMGIVLAAVGLLVRATVDDSGLRTTGLVVAGAGGVAIAVGLIAGAVMLGLRASSRD